jgi:hypothetical protein
VQVSSRFLVGLGAWLLGTATATTGSMVAVNVLAQHLLDPQTMQLAGTTVSADPDPGASGAAPSPAASATPTVRASRPTAKSTASPARNSSGAGSQPSSDPPAGTLLVFADGSVMATCEPAGAYLLYWSPDQGFEVPPDDVHRGPAAMASVLFRGQNGNFVMRVTCSGGTPVAHVYQATDGDDGSGSSPSPSPSGHPTDE